jgi:redox-sensitive bicupin YhaK (pirin superfamily)
MNRTVRTTIPTRTVREGGGFVVRRPAAMGAMMSPFLLLDEMGPVDYGPGEAVGAPSHPHRGFETVTYLLDGCMVHEDSAGNSGTLRPGDVQWMTAGRGVIHSELPHEDLLRDGGRNHGFQIWVNLPAQHKMMAPRYQDVPSASIPEVTSEDGAVWAKVIAGQCLGAEAVIDTVLPITYLHLRLQPSARLEQPLAEDLNAMLYVFGGDLKVEGRRVVDGQLALLAPGETVDIVAGDAGAELLVLAGPNLDEPIARYGPFVMNTEEEIIQAIQDYNAGRLA